MPKHEDVVISNGRRKLPFKLAKAPEKRTIHHEVLGDLDVPIYGGVLSGEAYEFAVMMKNEERRSVLEQMQGKTSEQIQELMKAGGISQMDLAAVMGMFSIESATVIAKYRLDPYWTRADTEALPMDVVAALSAILQEEMNAANAKNASTGSSNEDDTLDPQTTQQN